MAIAVSALIDLVMAVVTACVITAGRIVGFTAGDGE